METTPQILLALIGIIVSFASVLIWLIKQQHSQLEVLTNRFLSYMENTAVRNAETQLKMTTSLGDVSAALGQVTATLTQIRDGDRAEHAQILDHLARVQRARATDPSPVV